MDPKELQKTFMELQNKLISIQRALTQVKTKVVADEREKRRNMLTAKELDELAPTTNVYRGVGKMFVLSSIPEVKRQIEAENGSLDEEVQALVRQKEYLERQLVEAERNLEEFMKSHNIRVVSTA